MFCVAVAALGHKMTRVVQSQWRVVLFLVVVVVMETVCKSMHRKSFQERFQTLTLKLDKVCVENVRIFEKKVIK